MRRPQALLTACTLGAACATSPLVRAGRHMDRGSALLEKGSPGPAALEYRMAAEADPARAEASLMAGVAFYRAALAGGGTAVLDSALDDLRKAAAAAAKDAEARLALAMALKDKGLADDALEAYAGALELQPRYKSDGFDLESALVERGLLKSRSDTPWNARKTALAHDFTLRRSRITRAEVLLRSADGLREKGDPAAVAQYQKALEQNPRLVRAYAGLGLALMEQGRSGGAFTSLRRGVELGPEDPAAHAALGRGLLAFHAKTVDPGSLTGAVASLRRAAELAPKDAAVQADLARALRRKSGSDKTGLAESVAAWKRAIALDPKRGAWHAGLGDALLADGRTDEAITASRMAVDMDPEDGAAYQGLGEALAVKGELDDAIVQYKRAVVRRPKEALWHVLLGDLYARKGKPEKAADLYQEALKLGGNDPQIHFSLGMAFKKSGQRREAALSLKRFLDGAGRSGARSELDQARKALKELEGTK